MGLDNGMEHVEIERRFFVDGDSGSPWRKGEGSSEISQFYLSVDGVAEDDGWLSYMGVHRFHKMEGSELELFRSLADWIARLRLVDGCAVFTFKGRRTEASAHELEWEVPLTVGEAIVASGTYPSVTKRRYRWLGMDGLLWEVDEFEGSLEGLVLAEVELPDENHPVDLPSWLGIEITGNRAWSNAQLAHVGPPLKLS